MPAHLCDHIPIEQITDELASSLGWPKLSLICNRLADECAQSLAKEIAPIQPSFYARLKHEVFSRQACLARLNLAIGMDQPVKNVYITKEEQSQEQTLTYRSRFPDWDWAPIESSFEWKPSTSPVVHECCGSFANHDDCQAFQSFLVSLKWKQGRLLSVAYVELAFLFVVRKYSFATITASDNFAVLVKILKRMSDAVCAKQGQKLIPGKHERDQSHHCGRALPRGAIFGYRPYFSTSELEGFARLILEGGGRTLKTWTFELDAVVLN